MMKIIIVCEGKRRVCFRKNQRVASFSLSTFPHSVASLLPSREFGFGLHDFIDSILFIDLILLILGIWYFYTLVPILLYSTAIMVSHHG